MPSRRLISLALFGLGVAAAALPTAATAQLPVLKFPLEVELAKPLGFRTGPSLTAPPVLTNLNYLQPPTRVKLVSAQGTVGAPGAFCEVKYRDKQGWIRCDDVSAFRFASAPPRAAADDKDADDHAGSFCDTPETCLKFCASHCKLNTNAWSTTCTFPAALIEKAGDLKDPQPIPDMPNVKSEPNVRAGALVIDGLRKANDWIASHPGALPDKHVLMVDNCYRATAANSTRSCDFVLKAQHRRSKWESRTPQNAEEEADRKHDLAEAVKEADPAHHKGIWWPGPGNHTRGAACDIKIATLASATSKPNSITECRIEHPNDPKIRDLSRRLDEIMTNSTVGAVRLNYEMWHFEFGHPNARNCRCVAPICADKHWPPKCEGPSGC
jgi:hypothetical protein